MHKMAPRIALLQLLKYKRRFFSLSIIPCEIDGSGVFVHGLDRETKCHISLPPHSGLLGGEPQVFVRSMFRIGLIIFVPAVRQCKVQVEIDML